MGAIVDVQMKGLRKLLDERDIEIELSPAAREWIANEGYDPAYGARPLKRVIQRNLQDELAEQILRGKIIDGQKVTVDVEGEKLAFSTDGTSINDGAVPNAAQ